jgi:hypothetical protein
MTMFKREKTIVLVSCLVVFLCVVHPVAAAERQSDLPWKKFSVGLGGFYTTVNTGLRLGAKKPGIGASADLEEVLGFDSTISIFWANMDYRFSDNLKHRVGITYFDLRRKSVKTLEGDLKISSRVLPLSTEVESHFNFRMFKLTYSYSFFMDDRIDARARVGLYIMPLEASVYSPQLGRENTSFIAPLPTLGLGFSYAFTPEVILIQNINIFYLEYDAYTGFLTDMGMYLEYNRWKNIGIGCGVNALNLHVESDGEDYPYIDFVGNIRFSYTGINLYAKYYF